MPLTYKYKVAALDFIAKDSPAILDSIKEDFKLVLNKRQKNTSEMFSLQVGNHFIDLEFAIFWLLGMKSSASSAFLSLKVFKS